MNHQTPFQVPPVVHETLTPLWHRFGAQKSYGVWNNLDFRILCLRKHCELDLGNVSEELHPSSYSDWGLSSLVLELETC